MNKTLLIGAGVAAAAALYVMAKKRPGEGLASTIGRELVGGVGSAATGAVIGLGEFVGIPATNASECDKDLAKGDKWAASFSCPANRFVGGLFNSTPIQAAEVADVRKFDNLMAERDRTNGNLGIVYDADNSMSGYDAMGNRIY